MGRRKIKNLDTEMDINAGEKKKKGGFNPVVIVGIVVAVLIVIVAVIMVNRGQHSGKYVCESFSNLGIDCYIEVSGKNVSYTIAYDTDGNGEISDEEKNEQTGDISFDGSNCTLSFSDSSISGTYDKKSKTITLISDSENGTELVFTKQ